MTIARQLAERTQDIIRKGYRLAMPPQWFTRPMVDFIINNMDAPLVGVEIGVRFGWNAETMMEALPIERLYCVDPYEDYIDGDGRKKYADGYRAAHSRLKKYGGKVQFILERSSVAVDKLPDNLDFVYIDGNHTYPYVKKDIEMYWPKIRDGGVLGGDDFYAQFMDVVRAVMKMSEKYGVDICHGDGVDWWFVKPMESDK